MCDTLVATGAVTADGVTLFAKNSDREPNEAHHLVRIPAADHAPGETVTCTYIDVPQVAHTYAVLLAKPFWIWGAEIGTNEHGVTIGNEAVFTKEPYGRENGLIGMDFLRLALERAATAREAVTVITELLAEHGQSGNCGFQHTLFYHNSFLIADPGDAWVLETSGRHWAARRIDGVYTISNGLTITDTWDLASPDLASYAVERGWCHSTADFSFAGCYSDFVYTTFSNCRARRARSMALLTAQAGTITPATMMRALRDHGADAGDDWAPDRGLTGATICNHAGAGPIRGSQTTGSMVSHLHPDHATHFVTGTAAPCTSVFKPAWVDAGLPDTGPAPTGTYDAATLFWRHEALHRATLRDYATRAALYQPERDVLEADFVTQALAMAGQDPAERAAYAARCFAAAGAAETRRHEAIATAAPRRRRRLPHRLAWHGRNRAAGVPPDVAPPARQEDL